MRSDDSGTERESARLAVPTPDDEVAPWLIVGVGLGLFLVAAVHHSFEIRTIDRFGGPIAAFLLDGGPALILALGGFWLARTDLAPDRKRTVFVYCLVGAGLFSAVMLVSLLIRAVEGRAIAEPLFSLLLAADAGGIGGFVAGYYNARARESARRAERATDALAFINGMLRHDLRNDIQVVRTYADLIRTGTTGDGETVADHAETIRKQTDQAVYLIESTDTIVKTLTDDPEFEGVDLAAVAAESADNVADAFDVAVTTELPESAPVDANEGLHSVVDNLLENAAEHNDAENPRIDVRIETDSEVACLRVRDNGPGISDEEDVFESRDENDHAGGLHLVETLVESYGGDVWFEDDQPQGCVFVVELPRAE